jgi:undecaprenyl diphosphate synthase
MNLLLAARGVFGMFRPRTRYIVRSVGPSSGERSLHLPEKMPRHVAIIMDGNGRWAVSRGLPRSAGHAAGTETLRDIIRACDEWGIEALSIYAFSTENWSRDRDEVQLLMGLLLKYFDSEIEELDEKNVRILILGDVEGLPGAQRDAVMRAMYRTRGNTGLCLNIALNYGGKAELARAARALAEKAVAGEIAASEIDERTLAAELYTSGQPDVDLIIRTSGEMRLSNFLPWQTAYAEMIFNPIYWPDYDRNVFLGDLNTYASRDRRFGGIRKL